MWVSLGEGLCLTQRNSKVQPPFPCPGFQGLNTRVEAGFHLSAWSSSGQPWYLDYSGSLREERPAQQAHFRPMSASEMSAYLGFVKDLVQSRIPEDVSYAFTQLMLCFPISSFYLFSSFFFFFECSFLS